MCIGAAYYLSSKTDAEPETAVIATDAPPSATPRTPRAATTTGNTITLYKERGQFWANGTLNGGSVDFLVDTGASLVAITPDAAQAAGIDTYNLTYDVEVSTANGITRAARVRIDTLNVGPIVTYDIDALIIPEGLSHSLLGMSFLSRLQGYSATPDSLTLTL